VPCCSTSSTQPKCMGSTRRLCRIVSRRDVTSQVEFGIDLVTLVRGYIAACLSVCLSRRSSRWLGTHWRSLLTGQRLADEPAMRTAAQPPPCRRYTVMCSTLWPSREALHPTRPRDVPVPSAGPRSFQLGAYRLDHYT